MNKGFILDGYPRNIVDAKAIFLDPIEGGDAVDVEGSKQDGDEEVKGDDASPFPGFKLSEKILPQYAVIFEGDNESIK